MPPHVFAYDYDPAGIFKGNLEKEEGADGCIFFLPSLCFQDRSRMYDSLNMHSLESSLIDIMRAEQDPMKSE